MKNRTSFGTLRPLGDAVLIQPEPPVTYQQTLKTSLIIPEAYKYGPVDPPRWGTVLAKGSACIDAMVQVKSRVCYGKFASAPLVPGDDQAPVIVRERDLLALDA